MNTPTSTGPTVLNRIRSLLAFRHQNPVARIVSMLLAFSIATLLVVGTGAAYADDTAPTDPTTPAADTSTPVDPSSNDPASGDPASSDPAPAPGSAPAPSTTDAASVPEAFSPSTSTTKTLTRTSSTSSLAVAGSSSNCNPTVSPQIPVTSTGNFEIDGNLPKDTPNTASQTYYDWTGVASWPAAFGAPQVTEDGFGDNGFTGGVKEFDDPSTWVLGNTPNGKSDVGTVRTWTQVKGGHILSYFGFNRSDCTGSVAYDLEYNQLDNHTAGALSYPHRTPGDLLFQFNQGGNGALSISHSFVWTVQDTSTPANELAGCTPVPGYTPAGGWCPVTLDAGAFFSSASSDRLFIEGMLDLSKVNFPNNGCLNQFGTLNLRSHTSESDTSALQDSVDAAVSTPPGCGQLTINKFRAGTTTKLPGATFVVKPNPATGAAGSAVVVTDNQVTPDAVPPSALPAGISNPTAVADPLATRTVDGVITFTDVEPGHTYTVYEVLPPDGGYFLPSPNYQSIAINAASGDTPATTGHLDFYDAKIWQALTATKDGAGTYKVTYDWTIDKKVADTEAGPWYESRTKQVAGSSDPTSADFGYQVTLTQGAQHTTEIAVKGDITVTNPNSEDVVADVTDLLDGADCSVTGGTAATVTPGSHKYAYTCTYPDGTLPEDFDTTNVAKVTWDASTYPQDDGTGTPKAADDSGKYVANSAPYTIAYTPTETHKNVTVTDLMTGGTHHVFSPAWTATWTAEGTEETRTYTEAVSSVPGTEKTVVNTAYVKDAVTGATIDQNDATAILEVGKDLAVTKNAFGTITRSYLWTIDKRPCGPAILASVCDLMSTKYSVGEDGTVTVPYTVEATPDGSTEIGWMMTGEITVTNDNTWEDVTLSSVSDAYPGGTCVVDTSNGLTVPKSDSKTYPYSCTFTSQPSKTGVNTATANWDKAAAATPTGTDDGTYTLTVDDWTIDDTDAVNKTINVYDDKTDPAHPVLLGQATWNDAGTPTLFDYSLVIDGQAGACITPTNTAYLAKTADGTRIAWDSVTVTVCAPKGLTLAKSADGSYDRTYHWTLSKQVKNDQGEWVDHATQELPAYTAPFDYRVVLAQDGFDDSNWAITGDITVSNTNDASVTDPVSTTLTDTPDVGGTLEGCTRTSDGEPLDGTVVTLASGTSTKVGYECTFSAKPDYTDGTNTVSGTNATPDIADVTFAVAEKIDDQVTVYDDLVISTDNDGLGVLLGTAGYDEATPDATYHWDYPLSHTAESVRCQDFVNTAKVFGDDSEGPVAPDAQATATVCPIPGTWEVSKSVAEDRAVKPGTTLHYTLTARKTGGVDPEGIDVVDDLGPMVKYLTGDPLVTTEDADTSYADGKLTWHIATLSGIQTLDFEVVVKSDAYGVDLPNLVTSPHSDNCVGDDYETAADECKTDNVTPHYTLQKSSNADDQVMPPYLEGTPLEQPGTLITYTLTVHNDSDAPIDGTTMPGEKVTDDLSDVLDNADWVGNIAPAGQAEFDGAHTLAWTLPTLAADDGEPGGPDEATLHFDVRVAGDQWDETLKNVAHHGPGGNCVPVEALVATPIEDIANCTTTTVTPKYALIEVKKVDADQPALGLPGAHFTLSQDGTVLESDAVSDADGVARFVTKLQKGTFQVTETQAPAGYALPANPTQDVEVTDADLDFGNSPVEGAAPVPVLFQDPPIGSLALSKAHEELSGGSWVPGDGQVKFNDQVKYVITVRATGTKVFHDVTLTDYVPGYNPADAQTQLGGFKGVLDESSVSCGDFTCTHDYNASTGLVTWHLSGNIGNRTGSVSFVVRMPDLPRISPLAGPGVAFAGLMWNQAYLSWTQADDAESAPPHSLPSNEITDAANEVLPPKVNPPQVRPPAALPNTGGPDAWILMAGLVLLLGGGLTVAGGRLRRHQR